MKTFLFGFACCVKNGFLAFFPNQNVLCRGYIDLLSHTFYFGIQSQRRSFWEKRQKQLEFFGKSLHSSGLAL
jgi:hypothetical protein